MRCETLLELQKLTLAEVLFDAMQMDGVGKSG